MTKSVLGQLVCGVLISMFGVAFAAANESRDLRLAARSGDLDGVRRLIEAGVDADASDDWGTTALLLAAKASQVEVAEFLLENGADPSAKESFFGFTALDYALWKGKPEYSIAKLLLAAGADNRSAAFAEAFEVGDLELAQLALKSGPVWESEAVRLRKQFDQLDGELAAVLAQLRVVPDPPPPTYTDDELAAFAGRFESREGEQASIVVRDGRLVLEGTGDDSGDYVLSPAGERVFGSAADQVTVRYMGRAGGIEGVSVERAGSEPIRMRVAEEEVAAGLVADLPDHEIKGERVHWPGFRGANRDGIGDGVVAPPADFDLESGHGVAWRIDVPGLGNSSPVIWGQRVFVTTAIAEGGSTPLKVGLTGAGDEVEENVEHRWLTMAFEKSTGEKLWESEVGRGLPMTKRHFKATQANSSPATDGRHVVVVFPTAGLACLSAQDGSILWQHELGGLNAGGFNDPGIQWGFAASPIIYDAKVFLQVDIHDGPYLAAWSLDSGELLWKTERPDVAPSWSTPAIWTTASGTDELVVNASVIRGYDPDSGKELWSLGPTSIQVVASPVLGPDQLFVSSGYPPARPIYAVNPGIRGDHRIESDEDAEGVLEWYTNRGGAYMPTPLLYRGLLYVVHHNARIVAHDARSGSPVYKARLSAGGTCTASPVAANGLIYQGTEEGTLYVLQAGAEHRELSVHEFGAPLMATPAISEGLLVVRTPSELIALASSGGKPRPESASNSAAASSD